MERQPNNNPVSPEGILERMEPTTETLGYTRSMKGDELNGLIENPRLKGKTFIYQVLAYPVVYQFDDETKRCEEVECPPRMLTLSKNKGESWATLTIGPHKIMPHARHRYVLTEEQHKEINIGFIDPAILKRMGLQVSQATQDIVARPSSEIHRQPVSRVPTEAVAALRL